MNKLSDSMVRHAQAIAQEVNAKALMLDASLFGSGEDLAAMFGNVDALEYRLVLMTPNAEIPNLPHSPKLSVLNLPPVPLTRWSQIKMAVVMGVAEKLFERTDLVVCMSGLQTSGRLDMMAVLKIGDEPEVFSPTS